MLHPERKLLRTTIFCVMALALTVSAAGLIGERTYTVNADFHEGVLDGVNCTVVPDQLQLNKVPTTFPYAWIANAADGTLSKIRTTDGVEVARYRTGPNGPGDNPSRTAVDVNGNCWVGNRGSGTVTKFLADGGVNTSTGPSDVKPWGTDGRMAIHVAVGGGPNSLPRAMAIDSTGRIWVGLYNENRYEVLAPDGTHIGFVNTTHGPYGAAIDGSGNLWSAVLQWGLERIDVASMTYQGNWHLGGGYGVAVDSNGIVWLGAYPNSGVYRFVPGPNVVSYHGDPTGQSRGRGVCVAPNGNIWVSEGYGTDVAVTKYNSAGAWLTTHVLRPPNPFNNPNGVGVDQDGNIIVVCQASNDVYKLNEATGAVMWQTPVGNVPYTYSDFTGFIVRNITQKTGTWTVVHDGGFAGMGWGTCSWTSLEPPNTSVGVRVRAADAVANLPAASWVTVSNGVPFGPINGQFIEVEARLTTTTETSPILYDLTITPSNRPPIAVAKVNGEKRVVVEQESHAGTEVILTCDESSDPDDNIVLYEWDFESDGIYDFSSALPVPVAHTYQLGGPYVATLRVTDAYGEVDTDTVVITVIDTTPPVVTCSVAAGMLWPPNHNLVDVGLAVTVRDICDPRPVVAITVYADEDDEEPTGDGHHSPDAKVTLPDTLLLRSERKGDADGRVYLIVVTATDHRGNVGFDCCTVVVPKSQSKKDIAAVQAQAASAAAFCMANGGAPPSGFFVVGDGPIIGPKQ